MTQKDSIIDTEDDGSAKFSWPRVAGFSFAIALHVSAFMLMLTPAAPPEAAEELPETVEVTFIEPPPPPPPPPTAWWSALSPTAA